MAEVSNFRRLNHRQEEFELEGEFCLPPNPFVDFDSVCPFFLDDTSASCDFAFDLDDYAEDRNCVSVEGEEMNFVTDLYESRDVLLPEDPFCLFDDSDGVDGSGPEFGFFREVCVDPESDYEDFEVNVNISPLENDVDENSYNYDGIRVLSDFHISDEFEWEEVSDRVQFDVNETLNSMIEQIDEIEIYVASNNNYIDEDVIERETFMSMIDQIDEVSISSNIDQSSQFDEDSEERGVEWEVLLAANNLDNMNVEFGNPGNHDIDNPIFGHFVENASLSTGSPPAAKTIVENLPTVILSKEELGENNIEVVCAVCKDDVVVGEKVTRLPCCHLYHKECILPWLGIRNTCPVCRYELPTDNVDYERRRRIEGSSSGATTELRYNFELLP